MVVYMVFAGKITQFDAVDITTDGYDVAVGSQIKTIPFKKAYPGLPPRFYIQKSFTCPKKAATEASDQKKANQHFLNTIYRRLSTA